MMGIWAAPLWATPSHPSALHVRKWAPLIWASYPSALLSVFLIYYVKARKGLSLQAAEEPGETATSNPQHLGLCKHWKTILVWPPGLHSNSLNRLCVTCFPVHGSSTKQCSEDTELWLALLLKKKKKMRATLLLLAVRRSHSLLIYLVFFQMLPDFALKRLRNASREII